MSDIVLELRFYGAKRKWPKGLDGMGGLLNTAADEIARLRTALSEVQQRARREALEEAAAIAEDPILCLSCGTVSQSSHAGECCDRPNISSPTPQQLGNSIRALIPSEPHDAEGRE